MKSFTEGKTAKSSRVLTSMYNTGQATNKPRVFSTKYKPHNFSGSNEVLKASKELKSFHRYLLNVKPKRLKNTFFKTARGIDFDNKSSDSEILKPMLEYEDQIMAFVNEKASNQVKPTNELKNFEEKLQENTGEKIRKTQIRIRSKKKYCGYLGKKSKLPIRNFDSYSLISGTTSFKKYDFTSIRIRDAFGSKFL